MINIKAMNANTLWYAINGNQKKIICKIKFKKMCIYISYLLRGITRITKTNRLLFSLFLLVDNICVIITENNLYIIFIQIAIYSTEKKILFITKQKMNVFKFLYLQKYFLFDLIQLTL